MNYTVSHSGIYRVITAEINPAYFNKVMSAADKKLSLTAPISVGDASYKEVALNFFYDAADNKCKVEFQIHKSIKAISAIEIMITMAEKLLTTFLKK